MVHTKRSGRAAAEAAALAAAHHPGVVELVDASDTTVRTRRVEGRPLAEIGPLAPEEVAGLAAAVATTLADLHPLGIVHGAVDASHVLVTEDGRPVLCSLGRGGDPPDDVAALGRLVTSLLAAGSGQSRSRSRLARRPRLGPMLAPPAAPALHALAADATGADAARRPSARALATAIHDRVPTARLPSLEATPLLPLGAKPRRRPPWPGVPRWVVIGSGPVVLLLGVGWFLVDREAPGPSRPPAPIRSGTSPPPPTAVSPPAHFDQGVLTIGGARYVVGRSGDVVVVGDWSCTGRATPVLVRPTTGEVFAFDAWPEAGRDVAARSLGRVQHASGARAVRIGGEGCDHLEVLRADGPPVRLEVSL